MDLRERVLGHVGHAPVPVDATAPGRVVSRRPVPVPPKAKKLPSPAQPSPAQPAPLQLLRSSPGRGGGGEGGCLFPLLQRNSSDSSYLRRYRCYPHPYYRYYSISRVVRQYGSTSSIMGTCA